MPRLRPRSEKGLTIYLSAMPGYVEGRWAEYGQAGLIADCVRQVRPGETFRGLSYEELREIAEHGDGKIGVRNPD